MKSVEMMLKSERVTGRRRGAACASIESAPHRDSGRNNQEPDSSGIGSASSCGGTRARTVPEPAIEAVQVPRPKRPSGLDEVFHLLRRAKLEEVDAVLDEGVLAYLSEHANEIAAEANHAFQPIGGIYEEFMPGAEEPLAETAAAGKLRQPRLQRPQQRQAAARRSRRRRARSQRAKSGAAPYRRFPSWTSRAESNWR